MRMVATSFGLFLLLIPAASAANFQAYNDYTWKVPIKCFNPVTSTSAVCPAGTISVSSSLPASLTATYDSFGNLVLTPKVQASPGITITINGTAMLPVTFPVDVLADPAPPLQIQPDTTPVDVTKVLQAVPTNPGP